MLNLSKRSRGVDNCFVPYRDSKLTRMLTDSLGGNTRTVFIATVSPIRESIEETISTLKFATSARQINNKVSKNLISSTNNEMINKLQREIKYLRDLLHMRR